MFLCTLSYVNDTRQPRSSGARCKGRRLLLPSFTSFHATFRPCISSTGQFNGLISRLSAGEVDQCKELMFLPAVRPDMSVSRSASMVPRAGRSFAIHCVAACMLLLQALCGCSTAGVLPSRKGTWALLQDVYRNSATPSLGPANKHEPKYSAVLPYFSKPSSHVYTHNPA